MKILFPTKTLTKSILGGSIFISWFPVIVFVIIQSLPNQHEHTQVSIFHMFYSHEMGQSHFKLAATKTSHTASKSPTMLILIQNGFRVFI